MKYYLILLVIFISSCAPKTYVQVYETKAVRPVRTEKDHFVYENDTLRIDYAFWAEKGILAFKITNKLNVPLYIDWNRSSFVKNNEKLDFWIDEQKTSAASYYHGYDVTAQFWHEFWSTYYGNGKWVSYGVPYTLGLTEGETQTESTTIKPEKITFIAPRSYILPHPMFRLYNVPGTLLNADRDYVEAEGKNFNDKPISTKMYLAEYDSSENVLQFRNFLTLSTSKDFTSEFYVDNAFFVSKIYELESSAFSDTYKKPNGFYILIPSEAAIENRKKNH